jgi:hypothetical protein
MSRKRRYGLPLAAAVLSLTAGTLAGCGDATKKAEAPAASPSVQVPVTVESVTPEPTATAPAGLVSKGLIFSVCDQQGEKINGVTAHDPTGFDGSYPHGMVFANELKFATDTSPGGCNSNALGRHAMTAFNYDGADGNDPFTRFYASKVQPDGSAQIGYYEGVPAGSGEGNPTFTPLTQTEPTGDGLSEILKDMYPSYYKGRVYFVRTNSDNKSKLWSVPANGGEAKAEPKVPGLRLDSFGNGFGGDENALFMPSASIRAIYSPSPVL